MSKLSLIFFITVSGRFQLFTCDYSSYDTRKQIFISRAMMTSKTENQTFCTKTIGCES